MTRYDVTVLGVKAKSPQQAAKKVKGPKVLPRMIMESRTLEQIIEDSERLAAYRKGQA